MGIGLFFLIGWNLIKVGLDCQQSGEVSLTLPAPFYPVAYGVAVPASCQCLVLLADIVKIFRGAMSEVTAGLVVSGRSCCCS